MTQKNIISKNRIAEERNFEQLKTDLLMTALAIISISIGLHEISNPAPAIGMTFFDWIDIGIVAIFIGEFLFSIKANGGFRSTLKKRWWELPSLIPITGGMLASVDGIALVRGVRILRLIRIFRLLRIVAVTMRFKRMSHEIKHIYKRAHITALMCAVVTIVFLGTAGIFAAESHNHERFKSFHECVWWALNMFTNVAYLDFQPATGMGRIVAGLLQLFGIAFIGIFTASMANAIIKETNEPDSDKTEDESSADGG